MPQGLALHQPVAGVLRFLNVVLKVNNDLERMGDQVVNIAERVNFFADKERVVADLDFVAKGEIVSKIDNQAVTLSVKRDPPGRGRVWQWMMTRMLCTRDHTG